MSARERLDATAYAALRAVSGVLFSFHGAQKVLGLLTAAAPPATWSQKWFGGWIELLGGVLVALGLFTRPAAFVASGTMAVAYWQFHALPRGRLLPIENGGELAALYCFVFLLIAARGGGALSLDRLRARA